MPTQPAAATAKKHNTDSSSLSLLPNAGTYGSIKDRKGQLLLHPSRVAMGDAVGLAAHSGAKDAIQWAPKGGVQHFSGKAVAAAQWFCIQDNEICAEVGDACSGGGLKVAEAVAEFNPLNYFRQAVLTV